MVSPKTLRENIKKTTKGYVNQIWLSDNPYYCNCEMIWMKEWLNNLTTSSGNHVIIDYKTLRCHSGMMKGKSIYKLTEVDMGCFTRWTSGELAGLGLDTVPKDDKDENVNNMKYDAFFCYR